MTNPLINEPPPPNPTTDDNGHPYDAYLRRVEFIDLNPPAPNEAPVHVLARVLFDGVIPPARIAKDGITVDLSGRGGTVVTMQVHPEDVQIGGRDESGTYTPHLIGGRYVSTPVAEGWRWTPVDEDDPESFIVCSIHVAEVHVR